MWYREWEGVSVKWPETSCEERDHSLFEPHSFYSFCRGHTCLKVECTPEIQDVICMYMYADICPWLITKV